MLTFKITKDITVPFTTKRIIQGSTVHVVKINNLDETVVPFAFVCVKSIPSYLPPAALKNAVQENETYGINLKSILKYLTNEI